MDSMAKLDVKIENFLKYFHRRGFNFYDHSLKDKLEIECSESQKLLSLKQAEYDRFYEKYIDRRLTLLHEACQLKSVDTLPTIDDPVYRNQLLSEIFKDKSVRGAFSSYSREKPKTMSMPEPSIMPEQHSKFTGSITRLKLPDQTKVYLVNFRPNE